MSMMNQILYKGFNLDLIQIGDIITFQLPSKILPTRIKKGCGKGRVRFQRVSRISKPYTVKTIENDTVLGSPI